MIRIILLLCLLTISDVPIVILQILIDLYISIVDFRVKILTYIEELLEE
jgi:hypothetical protein